MRKSLSQRPWQSRFNARKGRIAARFRWFKVLILLAALTLACGVYMLWQNRQPGQITRPEIAKPLRPKPAPQSRASIARTAESLQGNAGQNVLPGPFRADAAAITEWENVLAREKEPGGSYENRIALFRGFIESYPGTAESSQAQEKLRIWEDESRAFHHAEEFEREPGRKMCAILAQWQEFYEDQTTGLRRAFAWDRIQYWTKQVEDYLGETELTVRSASGLQSADTDLFGQGQPDPYFVLLEGNKVIYRSRTLTNNPSPIWNEKVRIYLWPGLILRLEIWDDDLIGRELLAGRVLVPFPVDGPYQISDGSVLINLEIQRTR
jgi:hypothetical protein